MTNDYVDGDIFIVAAARLQFHLAGRCMAGCNDTFLTDDAGIVRAGHRRFEFLALIGRQFANRLYVQVRNLIRKAGLKLRVLSGVSFDVILTVSPRYCQEKIRIVNDGTAAGKRLIYKKEAG